MLVCNVSLRPRRLGIAANVIETAAAADTSTIGQVVFATLVDDPANVIDVLDAYLGEIMVETASAADSVDATGGAGALDVIETARAIDAPDGGLVTSADVAETATGADTLDAAISVAWNPSDVTNVTLSNGNLTATSSSNGGTRTTKSYSSGKYYWEATVSSWQNANTGVGIATSTAVLSSVGATPTQAAVVFKSGNIWVNNVATGTSLGARANGNTIGIALDVGSKLIWFRVAPSGNWNNSGTADPATGTGGISISALTTALFALFCTGPVIDVATINVGGSAFSGSVPSGFTAGLT